MTHAVHILKVEQNRLKDEDYANKRMINAFEKENVEPDNNMIWRSRDTEIKLRQVNDAINQLILNQIKQ